MSIGVFAAVLLAALLHASWNAIVKTGGDKLQSMVMLSLGHGIVGLAIIPFFPMPDPASWGLLGLSVLFHLFYKSMLTMAYQRGDLSRVYPIARGTAPLGVLIFSLIALDDPIFAMDILGIITISLGILTLARGVFTNDENRNLLVFALLSAVGTAGYSISDGLGARASGTASGYIGWLFLLDALIFIIVAGLMRGKGAFPKTRKPWIMGLIAGGASVGAYWIAVWAMTIAPIALVTSLRETSVLFAVLIGILFLGEKRDKSKLLAAALILTGLVFLRL